MSDFGDRMKRYEGQEAGRRFIPLLPICARIDGKCFSSFTRDLRKPYDLALIEVMVGTTSYLVKETDACIGYTQSDEISLCWYRDRVKSQVFMDGKIQKMTSILASMATAKFNELIRRFIPDKTRLALFDCRVWQLPTLAEAANVFLWRENDATKNSISALAQAHFSHKRLQGKNRNDMQEMLMREKNINWNDESNHFKRGSWLQKREIKARLTPEELQELPEKHEAHNDPNLEITRRDVVVLDMPPFNRVVNREDVIFRRAEPRTDDEQITIR